MDNIALFGGAFDPPHVGHQFVCFYLLEYGGFDEVWLIPSYKAVFDKKLISIQRRLQMCRYLIEPFRDRGYVSEIERIFNNKKSYTIDTVKALKKHYHKEYRFSWVIGSDVVTQLSKWKDIDKLKKEISFYIVQRMDYSLDRLFIQNHKNTISNIIFPNISSTKIKESLRINESILGLIPPKVYNYIIKNKLYIK